MIRPTSVLLVSLLSLSACTMPGGTEWILICAAILLLFGGRKIPELMRGIGKGIRELNDAKSGLQKEFEEGMKNDEKENNKKASSSSKKKK